MYLQSREIMRDLKAQQYPFRSLCRLGAEACLRPATFINPEPEGRKM